MERLLTMPEVAEITRRPVDTLRYWRARGEGPPSFRCGRRVVYREADVASWIEDQRTAGR
jgi:predicted DNA-binding transcriptional regulator AlpA